MALDQVALSVGAKDLDVTELAQLRGLEDGLAAASARRDNLISEQSAGKDPAAGNRNSGNTMQAERGLGIRQRMLLGADAEPVTGILDVRAGCDLAFERLDRAANLKP